MIFHISQYTQAATDNLLMDTRDLRIFLHLADSLHFARTSAECYISPSSLTRLVQRLEDELGTLLFDRDNRSVRLTPAGELFREFAAGSLQDWEQFRNSLQQRSARLTGTLSVFCSVTASYLFLKTLLDRFRNRHPEVDIQLHTGDTALTIQRILDGREDIGIAARPDQLPAKLEFKSLGESPLVFIVPEADNPLGRKIQAYIDSGEPVPWEQIPMVLSETGLARSRVNHWFRQRGQTPRVHAQVSGHEAIVSMVSLGFGAGVVPDLVVHNSPKQVKVRILDVEPRLTPFTIGICSQTRKLKNPLIAAFWELSG